MNWGGCNSATFIPLFEPLRPQSIEDLATEVVVAQARAPTAASQLEQHAGEVGLASGVAAAHAGSGAGMAMALNKAPTRRRGGAAGRPAGAGRQAISAARAPQSIADLATEAVVAPARAPAWCWP